MDLIAQVAYLNGLFEGLGMDENTKEGKMFRGMLDVLDSIAEEYAVLYDENRDLRRELDSLMNADRFHIPEDELFEEDEDDTWEDNENELYQVVCPTCAGEIILDDEQMDAGELRCPACGETLELDYSDLLPEEEPDED